MHVQPAEKIEIEAGLLKTFQASVLMEGVFMLVVNGLLSFSNQFYASNFAIRIALFIMVYYGFLWGYLYLPWFEKRLKRLFLPLGLVLFTIVPIVSYFFTGYQSMLANEELEVFNFTMVLFWIIPVMLTAWQYRFIHVVLLIFGTTVVDICATAMIWGIEEVMNEDNLFMIALFIWIGLLIGSIITQLMVKQRSQRQSLAIANQKLVKYAATQEQLAISRERNRLALELHDTLVHTLSSVSVQLEAMRVRWHVDPEQSFQILQSIQRDTREGLVETRQALKDLRVLPLVDLGLVRSIEQMAVSASLRSGFHLQLSLPERFDSLSYDQQQYLYRLSQEALRNIEQHARAKNVGVKIEEKQGYIILAIQDDGCGFVPEAIQQDTHFGLQGMKERAQFIGAALLIQSEPEKGTLIQTSFEAV